MVGVIGVVAVVFLILHFSGGGGTTTERKTAEVSDSDVTALCTLGGARAVELLDKLMAQGRLKEVAVAASGLGFTQCSKAITSIAKTGFLSAQTPSRSTPPNSSDYSDCIAASTTPAYCRILYPAP